MRTNGPITIYNKYLSSGAAAYQRTVVQDVAFEHRKAANKLASGGDIAANAARVFIPMARAASYLKSKPWQALVSKTGKWTLQEGDVVVQGAVTDEITGGFTISSLKAKYDDVYEISSVDTMDSGSVAMQHFNVGLK
jgi:hypothetical protein